MAETIGGLFDRLSIINIKLSILEKKVAAWVKLPREELEKLPYEEFQANLASLEQLRLDHDRLIDEINDCLAESARTGQARVDARVKLT